jgi:hypothetical protein
MHAFNTAFPWIGLVGAFVLLFLLFATNMLQADRSLSRWRDLTWLSWAGATAYLLHNVEEYGVDLFGRAYAFPTEMCGLFGFQDLAACPVPPEFFTAVNVPMFWIGAPLAALLSRRHPLVGLAIYSVTSVNLVAHVVGGAITGTIYNPGWLTALALFLPLTSWTAHVVLGGKRLSGSAMIYLAGWGVALHLILLGSLFPLMTGLVKSSVPSIGVQVLNAALLVIAPYLAERWRCGALLRGAGAERRCRTAG